MPDGLGIDRARVLVVVRTPPEVSLYHRHGNPLFVDVLERLGGNPGVHAVVLPRTPSQRDGIAGRGLPSLVVPEHAVDALSLVAARRPRRVRRRDDEPRGGRARDAVCTTFSGRMGAVDESLLAAGRLRALASGSTTSGSSARETPRAPATRDPSLLLDRLLPPA